MLDQRPNIIMLCAMFLFNMTLVNEDINNFDFIVGSTNFALGRTEVLVDNFLTVIVVNLFSLQP